jgi:hypothetical protein
MRKAARILSLLILLTTVLSWLFRGAHTGWSQSYTTRMEIDPITEIEYPVKTEEFVPGVDFLGLSILVSLGFFGLSFLLRRKPQIQSKTTQ